MYLLQVNVCLLRRVVTKTSLGAWKKYRFRH